MFKNIILLVVKLPKLFYLAVIMKSVFEFYDYKSYLSQFTGPKSGKAGVKSAWARELNCQPTYVSQVLNKDAHFSLEQAQKLAVKLELTKLESHYFLLMVQKARAGSINLENYFDSQLEEARKKRLVLRERLQESKELSATDQAQYYSSWIYAAFHIGLTLESLKSINDLKKFFSVGSYGEEVVDFLLSTGLIVNDDNQLKASQDKIRIGRDSFNLIKHHTNWRQRAIESLEEETHRDLHYSGVASLSEKDALVMKDFLLEKLKEFVDRIGDSKEEEVYCLNIDWFSLKKN